MTTTFITTNTVGAGTQFTYLAAGDALVILPGVTLGSTNVSPIAGTGLADLSLEILGTLVSSGIIIFSGGGTDVHISAGATFFSSEPSSANAALFLSASGSSFVNDGSLTAPNTFGLLSQGGSTMTNHGAISATSGVFLGLGGSAGDRFTNSGSVQSSDADDAFRDQRYNNAVLTEGAGTVITNLAKGTITAVSSEGAGVRFNEFAGGSILDNWGHIQSLQDFGVNLSTVSVGAALIRVSNWGTISGFDGAYLGSVNDDLVRNRGTFDGGVSMGDGADTLDNRGGTIDGDVLLGVGADTLDTRSGTVLGIVNGDAGSDRFILNAAVAETVDGGADIDTIDFRFGPAVTVALDGSFDNEGGALGDTYIGIERVVGSVYADVIRGSAANNLLFGQAGADTIDGAAGSDLIHGGTGVDSLTGGLGNDTFRYSGLGEIGDTITDFQNVAGDNDRFQIIASAFGGGLIAGTLAATQFQTRADNLAQDADDRFIFRTTDQTLWFDDDGNGVNAAVLVADLQAGATVTAADIILA